MKYINNVIYRIKNILFILFLYSYIRLIPNIFECDLIGMTFLWLGIIYTILMFVCYVKKDELLIKSNSNNILSIGLYLYIFIITLKYLNANDLYYNFDLLFFKINYIIASLAIIGVGINNIFIINYNSKKCD